MDPSYMDMDKYVYSVAITEPLPGESAIYRHPKSVKGLIGSPDPEKIKTLRDVILNSYEKYPNNKCLGAKNKTTCQYEWKDYKTSVDLATDFASGLLTLKLVPPVKEYKDYELHMLGVYSKNRVEYMIADIACMLYGLTSVPIYDTLGPQGIEFILEQTKMTSMVVAEDNLRRFVASGKFGLIKNVISFETITDAAFLEELETKGLLYYSMDQIIQVGHQNLQQPYPVYPNTIYVVSYTSGTTGSPKGAMLTHANFVSLVAFGVNSIRIYPEDIYLSFLPMAHVFERLMISMLLYYGVGIGYFSGDILKIREDFAALKPTCVAMVPRLINKFYDGFKTAFDKMTGVKGWLARHALNVKLTNLHYYGNNQHWIHDTLVFKKIREALGGRIRWMTLGSAPTCKETLDFMKVALSVSIQEGYGQTEGTGASFVMHWDDHKGSGTVGGPGVQVEFKLKDVAEMNYTSKDKDEKGRNRPRGEMCLRGPPLFAGYYKDEEKTKEAIDEDGWLHTGDICELEPNGSIKIVDRKKNIFKLSQGEYIAPEKIENVFNKCKTVKEIFVYGDALENYLVAVIVVEMNNLTALAVANGIKESVEEMLHDKKIKLLVLQELKAAGVAKKLTGLEFVKNVHLEKDPFASKDLITTTFKLKRFEAKKVFIDAIKELYKEGPLIN